MRRSALVRATAQTTAFDVTATAVAALAGLLIARELGAAGRGEYAAVTAWFGVVLVLAEFGQMAATCFYVAREPDRAPDFVATSRSLMIASGTATLIGGVLVAPYLSHGVSELTWSYRLAFAACLAGCLGITYIAALQGRNIRRWNLARSLQPVFFLVCIIALMISGSMTLLAVIATVTGTIAAQAAVAYVLAVRSGLGKGRTRRTLVRPLTSYGASQLLATTPAVLNTRLDQLVLSQAVPAAELGRYAVAASLTSMALPFAAAIGYVAFPRLASRLPLAGGANRLQKVALIGSAGVSTAILLVLAALCPWFVPLLFGPDFIGSIPLIWILTPAGILLACGQVAGDLLRGRGQPLAVAWSQGLAVVLTVVVLLALLPAFGVYAAAIASTLAYGLALTVMLRKLRRLPDDLAGGRTVQPRPGPSWQDSVEQAAAKSPSDPPSPNSRQSK